MVHVLEKSKDERIHRGTVLRPAFDVGCALHVMRPARRAVVGPGVGAAILVELEADRIAATLGKNLEYLPPRVVAPDPLAKQPNALDFQIRGAAGGAVQPAVGSQVEAGRQRVRIFKTEPGKMHFRITVRNVVTVPVRIEEEVGRLQNPDSAVV